MDLNQYLSEVWDGIQRLFSRIGLVPSQPGFENMTMTNDSTSILYTNVETTLNSSSLSSSWNSTNTSSSGFDTPIEIWPNPLLYVKHVILDFCEKQDLLIQPNNDIEEKIAKLIVQFVLVFLLMYIVNAIARLGIPSCIWNKLMWKKEEKTKDPSDGSTQVMNDNGSSEDLLYPIELKGQLMLEHDTYEDADDSWDSYNEHRLDKIHCKIGSRRVDCDFCHSDLEPAGSFEDVQNSSALQPSSSLLSESKTFVSSHATESSNRKSSSSLRRSSSADDLRLLSPHSFKSKNDVTSNSGSSLSIDPTEEEQNSCNTQRASSSKSQSQLLSQLKPGPKSSKSRKSCLNKSTASLMSAKSGSCIETPRQKRGLRFFFRSKIPVFRRP